MNVGFINLGSLTADPASPQNGAMWYNATLGKFRVRENGVTKDADTGGGTGITEDEARRIAIIFG